MTNGTGNSLWNMPLDDIGYEAIFQFCEQEHKEGLALDYKSDWPNDLAALMASFANTQGGIILIGVEEEGKSRLPVSPPVGVAGDIDVNRGRVFDIAFDAIYPPVTPEVKICQLPGEDKKHVIFIRIDPTRKMHTVDQRKKVYIRVEDSKRGYDYADIEALKWFSEGLESGYKLRELLLSDAIRRSDANAFGWRKNKDYKSRWKTGSYLEMFIAPTFPDLITPIPSKTLSEIIPKGNEVSPPWANIGLQIPPLQKPWRAIPNGLAFRNDEPSPRPLYGEVSFSGSIYLKIFQPFVNISETSTGESPEPDTTIFGFSIIGDLAYSIDFAAAFYEKLFWRMPLTIKATLNRVLGKRLLLQEGGAITRAVTELSTDENMTLLDIELPALNLRDSREDIELDATKSLSWSFGWPWSDQNLAKWLDKYR